MTGKKQAPKTITQEMNELHAQLAGEISSRQAARASESDVDVYATLATGNVYAGGYTGGALTPDYFALSFLKRADEGALWERHTEYYPTHEDSTTRALSLSSSGAVCVRTQPMYWKG